MRRLLPLLLLVFIQPLYAQERFTDIANHFSFIIPPGWSRISKEIFDEATREIEMARRRKGSGNLMPGIQYGNPVTMQIPYILIQIHREKMSWDEFREGVSSITDDDIKTVQKSFSDFLFGLYPANSYLDYEKKMFVFNMKSDVLIAGNARSTMVMFLGRNSIVQLNINALEEHYNQFLPDILAVINSFEFDNGYEYLSQVQNSWK
jgi:hypothetical protein